MIKILGIHDGHNSSACLLVDGKVHFAIQEERLRRIKNYWGIPFEAINACLDFADLAIADIDVIAIASDNQTVLRDQNINRDMYMSSLHKALNGKFSVREKLSHIKSKLLVSLSVSKGHHHLSASAQDHRKSLYISLFPTLDINNIQFVDHHLSHYATAAYGSGWWGKKEFLVFTNDGQGDGLCASVRHVKKDGAVDLLSTIDDHHSVANLFGIVTACLGFNILEDEHKIMGMAPYAKPEYAKKIGEEFLALFQWNENAWVMQPNIKRLMDRDEKNLKKEIDKITHFQRFDNICGGIQYAFEKMITKWIKQYTESTGVSSIALAGGGFMNIKANLSISKLGSVKEMFVFPSCGDETIAIGAAYYLFHKESGKIPQHITDIYYGNEYTNDVVKNAVADLVNNSSISIERPENITDKVASLLADNQIVARFSGRGEFGARALGNRSILANPKYVENIQILNDMIKKRDFWMPFACSLIEDKANIYLDNPKNINSPYMIMAFNSKDLKNKIKAAIHPRDYTVRPQVVSKSHNKEYYEIIKKFDEITGVGGLLNTSFNLHRYPLVETPGDAIDLFLSSGLKYLVIQDTLISKI